MMSSWEYGFLSFQPIFPISGLDIHSIAQTLVELEFWFFASDFFLWIFNLKKMVILEVLGHFLKKFLYRTMKLG